MKPITILEQAREKFIKQVVLSRKLDNHELVEIDPLSPRDSIGFPDRQDFPLIEGKEHVVQARLGTVKGQAFTDSPCGFFGTLQDILNLPLGSNSYRADFIATLNAVCFRENLVSQSVHCKDDEPERCGREIAADVEKKWGKPDVGLIGYNPAIAESLVQTFTPQHVRITDLNFQNIHAFKYGVEIWNGRDMTEELIVKSRVVLITGTTLVNGTFDSIWKLVQFYKRDYLVYGVTCAAVAELMGLNRICPFGRPG